MARKETTLPATPSYIEAVTSAAEPFLAKLASRKPTEWMTTDQEQAVVALLALMDGNTLAVHRMLNGAVGHTKIWELKMANQEALAERREAFKRAATVESQEVFLLATAQVKDKLHDSSARDAAVIAGIYADKRALFAGDATLTVRHVHTPDMQAVADVLERIRQLQPSAEEIPTDFVVRDVE